MLSQKVSGTSAGLWLLIPEFLRLGAWDLLKAWTGKADMDFEPRIALQMVNESALCVNRVRRKNSLGLQGFELANGMGRLVTDEQVHNLLGKHSMGQTQELMVNLGMQRQLSGHYQGDIIAMDPHRIISSSKRVMSKKQKDPKALPQKMLQTFFTLCPQTGQPIMATMSSTGFPVSKATVNLIASTSKIIKSNSLLLADKEHFAKEIFTFTKQTKNYGLLVPAKNTSRIQAITKKLDYKPLWAGFAVAQTKFYFDNDNNQYRLIAERLNETEKDYKYNAFITTSKANAEKLICKDYDNRWTIEEFYRFENEMGMNRASTLNLNIRYASMAMALIAQAATYQLRMKLKDRYKTWNARHLSNEILAWADGDIRVEGDTIIVTYYKAPMHINPMDYCNLPEILIREGINPKIPWLYGYKLNFRFK